MESPSIESHPSTLASSVRALSAVPTPARLCSRFPLASAAASAIERFRAESIGLVHGRGDRLLVVVGPCSIHDPRAALDYAVQLLPLAELHARELFVVMRVYLEKPRSSVGWKGFINDPHLDGRCDIGHGLTLARELMTKIAELGLPIATELLDGNLTPYFVDLITWAAIGARTTESQPHRELASSLPFAVGFKNGTDGRIDGALGGIRSAAQPHRRLAPNARGRLTSSQSLGNPNCHLTLRGGVEGPNYAAEHVARASLAARQAQLPDRVLVDCSHGNSGKDHENQSIVASAVARQVASGSSHLLGAMIESHLVAGRQNPTRASTALRYGQSITDACVDLPATARMLGELARAVQTRRSGVANTPSVVG